MALQPPLPLVLTPATPPPHTRYASVFATLLDRKGSHANPPPPPLNYWPLIMTAQ